MKSFIACNKGPKFENELIFIIKEENYESCPDVLSGLFFVFIKCGVFMALSWRVNQPLIIVKYSYKNSNFAQVDGKFIYFDLPSSLNPLKLKIEPKDRKYPYESLEDSISEKTVEIEYPKGYLGVMVPKQFMVKEKLYSVTRIVKNSENKIYFLLFIFTPLLILFLATSYI